MRPYTGILHLHSTYSYDGRHSLGELRAFALRRGYAFVGMTEHVEGLTPRRVAAFVEECRRLSTRACRLLPGLEYSFPAGPHLMAFGLTERLPLPANPAALAARMAACGAAVVLAHPARYPGLASPELAENLQGIEVWNQRYDGRFVPDPRWWALLRRLRRANPRLHGFGGLDLHEIAETVQITTTLEAEDASERGLCDALRAGRFALGNGRVAFPASGERTAAQVLGMATLRPVFDVLKAVRDRMTVASAPRPTPRAPTAARNAPAAER